jgi:hypothetical protein
MTLGLVVLLRSSEILTSLLYTFTDVPVRGGTFRVEEIELESRRFQRVAMAVVLDNMHMLRVILARVTTRDVNGGFITDTEPETSGAPVDEVDGALGFHYADNSIGVLGDDITVKRSAGHWR